MMKSVILPLLLLLVSSLWANQQPAVTHVQVIQQPFPSELVQIIYDVYDADGDAMTISLQISSDGGVTWTVLVNTVSGTIGNGIMSGVNYEIIWNAGIDYPEQVGTQYRAKILADDCHANMQGDMVYVPEGPFEMGATYHSPYAQPIHTANVPAFYIDIYEVTNSQYKAFCDATNRAYPTDPGFPSMSNYFTNSAFANYPVSVDWNGARAYAAWAGKRLPTEAEWERAAKGNTDNRQWPWGDTWVDTYANVGSNNADGYDYTSPVGSFPEGVSPVGCYDMTGNVFEWCEDDWHPNYTGAPTDGSAWIDNPRAEYRISRSSSWYYPNYYSLCAFRDNGTPTPRYGSIGFRCAKTP
jgi:formylglycine-generating enzyme required for sulfatase activity